MSLGKAGGLSAPVSPTGSELSQLYGYAFEIGGGAHESDKALAKRDSGSITIRSDGAYFKWADLDKALASNRALSKLYLWYLAREGKPTYVTLKLKVGTNAARNAAIVDYLYEVEQIKANFKRRVRASDIRTETFYSKAACKDVEFISEVRVELTELFDYQLNRGSGPCSVHQFTKVRQAYLHGKGLCVGLGERAWLGASLLGLVHRAPKDLLSVLEHAKLEVWCEVFQKLWAMLVSGETNSNFREFTHPGLHSKAIEKSQATVNEILDGMGRAQSLEFGPDYPWEGNELKPLQYIFDSSRYEIEQTYEVRIFSDLSAREGGSDVAHLFFDGTGSSAPLSVGGSTLVRILKACAVNEFDVLVIENRTPFLSEGIASLVSPRVKPLLVINGEGNRICGAHGLFGRLTGEHDSLESVPSGPRVSAVYYFGDLDRDGFAILSRFRNLVQDVCEKPVKSIKMDVQTLDMHREYLVADQGSASCSNQLGLTIEERQTLAALRGMRLEQEAIRL